MAVTAPMRHKPQSTTKLSMLLSSFPLVLILVIWIYSGVFEEAAAAVALQSETPTKGGFSDPFVGIPILDISEGKQDPLFAKNLGNLFNGQSHTRVQTGKFYCEPASRAAGTSCITARDNAEDWSPDKTGTRRKTCDIWDQSSCYLPMDVHRVRVSVIHDHEIQNDLLSDCYRSRKPQMLYSYFGSMRRVEFLSGQLYLISDKFSLSTGHSDQRNSEPGDDASSDCGNCTGICVQPIQKSAKRAHYKYDWILGLAVILSPFIAGYFACKQVRDLDAYINRNTKTIDKP